MVEFQIGKYKEKVLYDIVPMDAYHFLLGIPWKYDVEAHYDGKLKTYTIRHRGERVTLLPLPNFVEE